MAMHTPNHILSLSDWYKHGNVIKSIRINNTTHVDFVKFENVKYEITYRIYRCYQMNGEWQISEDANLVFDDLEEHTMIKIESMMVSIMNSVSE